MAQEKQCFHLRECFKEQGTSDYSEYLILSVLTFQNIPLKTRNLAITLQILKNQTNNLSNILILQVLLSSLLSTHHLRGGTGSQPFQIRGKLNPTVRIQKYLALPKLAPDIFKKGKFCSEQTSEVSLWQSMKRNQDNFFWPFTLICHEI